MAPTTPLRILALTALATLFAPAQTAPAKTAPPEPEYVTTRDFKNRLFIVKHVAPNQLVRTLRSLTSGSKGSNIEATDGDGLRTITIRDFPENLAAVEDAIKRLDVPQARLEVELHIHVLQASRQEAPSEGFPEEMKAVLATLKTTLNYRSFVPATSFVVRVEPGSYDLNGRGQAELATRSSKGEAPVTMNYDWKIRALKAETDAEGPLVIYLGGFELCASERTSNDHHGDDLAKVRTDLTLKDGETVVVGTSTVKDKGLIVVVTAKVLK